MDAATYRPFPHFADWIARPLSARDFDAALADLDAGLPAAEILPALGAQAPEAAEDLEDVDSAALQHVVEVATGQQVISETTIRSLHRLACAHQESYRLRRDGDRHDRPLVKGAYKEYPNHPVKRPHAYAPVARTSAEISRLIVELGSPAFLAAHPVSQAAYALYALLCIHPFADGNGRVARALAAICLERATGRALPIQFQPRRDYLDALAAADEGDFEVFSRFVAECAARGMQTLLESSARPRS